ncbi:MAG: AAA family ATPase [Candidatus Omnitrophica bacterium]|nr:AAA family ATPase [Candidatus Omnitrophota bacterium]
MEGIDYKQKSFYAGRFFSPSTPIDKRSLFSGRDYQLDRVIDLIFARGQHSVIYGERGVGKTSLANILQEVLEPLAKHKILCSRVNCDISDSFSSLWSKTLNNVSLIMEEPSIGFSQQSKETLVSLKDLVVKENGIKIEDIRKLQQIKDISFVFIFDEFDRIKKGKVTALLADTIKMLSDYSIDVTIILIGVADSIEELVKEHASIDRSLVQILMPRMKSDELSGIINSAVQELKMSIDPKVKQEIVRLSQGLPHYTHLVGLAATRKALQSQRLNITDTDLFEGINDAINDAQQIIINAYTKATTSPRKDTLFKQVLFACALCQVDELGYFAPADVREPLERIVKHKVNIATFNRHLSDFCSEKRGFTLVKTGGKRRYRYRFKNPLLQPYVVMKGLSEKLLE